MTWLDEIENVTAFARGRQDANKDPMHLPIADRERMARVIRELLAGINIYDETCKGMSGKEGTFSAITLWWASMSDDLAELLPDDAKELLG